MRLRFSLVLACVASLALVGALGADTGFVANINSTQEVPVNASPAVGNAYCVLNNAQTQLSYTVNYTGLLGSRTASHFHGPASPGVNAPVVFGIASSGPSSGTIGPGVWNIDATNLARLLSGLLYINIHSSVFPGGEIRGQVLMDATPSRSTTWGRIKQMYTK